MENRLAKTIVIYILTGIVAGLIAAIVAAIAYKLFLLIWGFSIALAIFASTSVPIIFIAVFKGITMEKKFYHYDVAGLEHNGPFTVEAKSDEEAFKIIAAKHNLKDVAVYRDTEEGYVPIFYIHDGKMET